MKIKPFIKQQDPIIPPPPVPERPADRVRLRKRGRKKSHVTLEVYLFYRRIFLLHWYLRKRRSRRQFARYMGMLKWRKTLLSGMKFTSPEEDAVFRENQPRYDTRFAKPANITAVPVNQPENILQNNFEAPKPLYKAEPVFIRKSAMADALHYFAFIMSDNCMVHDGICKGDRIVAVKNVSPAHGDLVACTIPGKKVVTVRRFAVTSDCLMYNLFEGGTTNGRVLPDDQMDKVILGVVVNVQRSYQPGHLPEDWEYNEFLQSRKEGKEIWADMLADDLPDETGDEK